MNNNYIIIILCSIPEKRRRSREKHMFSNIPFAPWQTIMARKRVKIRDRVAADGGAGNVLPKPNCYLFLHPAAVVQYTTAT